MSPSSVAERGSWTDPSGWSAAYQRWTGRSPRHQTWPTQPRPLDTPALGLMPAPTAHCIGPDPVLGQPAPRPAPLRPDGHGPAQPMPAMRACHTTGWRRDIPRSPEPRVEPPPHPSASHPVRPVPGVRRRCRPPQVGPAHASQLVPGTPERAPCPNTLSWCTIRPIVTQTRPAWRRPGWRRARPSDGAPAGDHLAIAAGARNEVVNKGPSFGLGQPCRRQLPARIMSSLEHSKEETLPDG